MLGPLLRPLAAPLPPAGFRMTVRDAGGGLVVTVCAQSIESARKMGDQQLAQISGRAVKAEITDPSGRPLERRTAKSGAWVSACL